MLIKHSFARLALVLFLACPVFFFLATFSAYAQGEEQTPTEAAEGGEEVQEQEEADAGSAEATGDIPQDDALISEGQSLFSQNCTVCHAIDKKVVGPALKDVHKRRDLDWLIGFIRNSQKVIQSGDDYAVKLYNEYSKLEMPAFDFSDEEITSIVAYLADASEAPAPSADAGGETADGEGAVAAGNGVPSHYLTAIIVLLIVVLALILLVLVLIVTILNKYINQKTDLDEEDRAYIDQRFDVQAVVKSKPFIGIVSFVFLALVLKLVVDGLFTIGVQEGYAPKQPIAFSHKLHAGQYEIDCNYCHTGVRISKSANIPSLNICMNCHVEIKQESPEIAKIYRALDYDPENREYGSNQKPIEWVRIHNLPDLAYFNHAQHVEVGNIECQTCHGPVEEMEVVQQYSPLTMAWCINCHRETEVNAAGNAYYDKLVELHDANNREPMKVKDIGGLECSKCHY